MRWGYDLVDSILDLELRVCDSSSSSSKPFVRHMQHPCWFWIVTLNKGGCLTDQEPCVWKSGMVPIESMWLASLLTLTDGLMLALTAHADQRIHRICHDAVIRWLNILNWAFNSPLSSSLISVTDPAPNYICKRNSIKMKVPLSRLEIIYFLVYADIAVLFSGSF